MDNSSKPLTLLAAVVGKKLQDGVFRISCCAAELMHVLSLRGYSDSTFPFSLQDPGARFSGLTLKEVSHLLMQEEGLSRGVCLQAKNKTK